MARNYYCLVAGLPDLMLEQSKVQTGLAEFKLELEQELHPADYRLVQLLFLPYDHINLMHLLAKQEASFNPMGNYSLSEMEDEIKEPTNFPAYLQTFIQDYKYQGGQMVPEWENRLLTLYYQEGLQSKNQFMRNWLQFELDLSNLITAINCRKHQLPVEAHLIGENLVTESILRSSTRDFGLSGMWAPYEKVMQQVEKSQLQERELGLDLLKWNFLNDQNTFNYFSVEVVLSFVLKLRMAERWIHLDKETGQRMFQRLVDEMQKSFEFPKEFII